MGSGLEALLSAGVRLLLVKYVQVPLARMKILTHFPPPPPPLPTHIVINCGFLSAPLYGNVQVRHTTVGSTATYFCDRGFVLIGYVSRICQSDGRWSGEAPICNRK